MTLSSLPGNGDRRDRVARLLESRGASAVDHLNGELFAHLERTELLLRSWGCSEVVSVAGLAHAAYGTDGFPTALLELGDRALLSEVAGPDVEALVYLYSSCDRGFTYPRLGSSSESEFRDRFVGRVFVPTRAQLRDFVDLTLANEADVGLAGRDTDVAPDWLVTMFEHLGHLASESVRHGFGLLATAGNR